MIYLKIIFALLFLMEVFVVSPGTFSKIVGYRLVEVGELYQLGDQYNFPDGKWKSIPHKSGLAGNVYLSLNFHGKYRRPIFSPHLHLTVPTITCNEGRVI